MPVLNQSDKKKQERADIQDLEKFKLEDKLEKRLNRLFKAISLEWADVYAQTGRNIRFELFEDDMNAVLKDSYRDTSKKFHVDLRNQLEDQAESDPDNELFALLLLLRNQSEVEIRAEIVAEMMSTVNRQTGFILNTTEKVVNKHTQDVIDEAIEAGVFLSTAEIAKEARKRINKENKNRSVGIAQNEVGNAAEASKQTEATVFDDALSAGNVTTATGVAIFLIKTWWTVNDGKVRTSHRIANGQIRRIKEPFLVQGQLLMYPKDDSLGATIDNIARCRCESIIT